MNGRNLLGTLVLALSLIAAPAVASDSIPLNEGDSQEFAVTGDAGQVVEPAESEPAAEQVKEPEIVLDDPVTEPGEQEPAAPEQGEASVPVDAVPVEPSEFSEDVVIAAPGEPSVDGTVDEAVPSEEPADAGEPVVAPVEEPVLNPDGTLVLEPFAPESETLLADSGEELSIDPALVCTGVDLPDSLSTDDLAVISPIPADAVAPIAPLPVDGAVPAEMVYTTGAGPDALAPEETGLPLCPVPVDEQPVPVVETNDVIAPLPTICGGENDPCRNRFPMPPAPRPGRRDLHEDIDIDVNISTSVSINAPGNNNNIVVLNTFNGIPAAGSTANQELDLPQLAGLSPDIRALIEKELRD